MHIIRSTRERLAQEWRGFQSRRRAYKEANRPPTVQYDQELTALRISIITNLDQLMSNSDPKMALALLQAVNQVLEQAQSEQPVNK